jgi:hypothetical protein
VQVACPAEDAYVFDVETSVTEGHYPTLAAAVSAEAWYGWVSTRLHTYDPQDDAYFRLFHGLHGDLLESLPGTEELIPLSNGEVETAHTPKRVVIGRYAGHVSHCFKCPIA